MGPPVKRRTSRTPKVVPEPAIDIESVEYEPIEISSRTRKQELVDAYQDLVERYERQAAEAPPPAKIEAARKDQAQVVERAQDWTMDRVVTSLGELKLGLSTTLDQISQKIVDQAKKLADIGEAIDVQMKKLEELHDIEIAADSLAMLIERHREAEAEFEDRLASRQREAEQAFETAKTEVLEQIEEAQQQWLATQTEQELQRAREQEEYDYTLKQQRKRDTDAYHAKTVDQDKELAEQRTVQERELGEREAQVQAQEAELTRLRAEAEGFAANVDAAVAEARESMRKEHEREDSVKAEMSKREAESQQRLAELEIKNLRGTVTEQAQRIAELNKQLSDASAKVEKIATKAIDGASNKAALTAVNDIALEQARKPPAN